MSRAVLAPFESYQKSRVTFVQTVAELATRPQNIEALQSAGNNQSFSRIIRCDGPVETPVVGQRAEHLTVSCSGTRPPRKLLR